MKIYLVAGEVSGDILGAGVIAELKKIYPQAEFRGLGGQLMQEQGLTSLYPLEALSVMGILEVIKHLPRLLKIRRHLYADALAWGADLMLGIDSPDFNLGLEKKLRRQGIKTAHYVSPSVWAWRQGRIKGIKKSVDLMLSILPFEADFYKQHQVPLVFVGHPTADKIPLEPNKTAAKHSLNLAENSSPIIGILPGSRASEIERLAPLFLSCAQELARHFPQAKILLPAATPKRYAELEQHLKNHPCPQIELLQGQASKVLAAADACLLASGTVALEAMLYKTPMVISYKLSRFTWWLSKIMLKSRWVGLPNILANKEIVPERIQITATQQQLVADMRQILEDTAVAQEQIDKFHQLHAQIRCNASQKAAAALSQLLASV